MNPLALLPLALAASLQVPQPVDLDRYEGRWYEIAAIPQSFQKQCVGDTIAEYSKAEDGLLRVVNSCRTASGDRSVAEGRARVADPVSRAQLDVTFVHLFRWIFAFGGSYRILDLDPDYQRALIGGGSTKYAWLLSRTPALSREDLSLAEKKFREAGYDTCRLLTTPQTGGLGERRPLCEFKETP